MCVCGGGGVTVKMSVDNGNHWSEVGLGVGCSGSASHSLHLVLIHQ